MFVVQRYTKGVDMWSLGCILGEMLLGKALFPGLSTINQVEKIMSAIPHPSPEGDEKATQNFSAVLQFQFGLSKCFYVFRYSRHQVRIRVFCHSKDVTEVRPYIVLFSVTF